MLPEAAGSFQKDGWDDIDAGLLKMGCFVGGFVVIQVLSRVMHQLLPHHVVDCDHSHSHDHGDDLEDPKNSARASRSGSRQNSRVGRPKLRAISTGRRITTVVKPHVHSHADGDTNGHAHHHHHGANDTEHTPLLGNGRPHNDHGSGDTSATSDRNESPVTRGSQRPIVRRPSMRDRLVSIIRDKPEHACDGDGSCFGFSDPCGQECFKHVSSRNSVAQQSPFPGPSRAHTTHWTPTAPLFEGPIPEANSEDDSGTRSPMSPAPNSRRELVHHPVDDNPTAEHEDDHSSYEYSEDDDLEGQEFGHHHHVPENAFLSISFQTVVAIALHKLPEGFITYATNHTNPQLGFNVFMALFVHNIAEGFAMALPLYMAFNSRLKAIAVTMVLGGFTQPLGAGIGWLVIKFLGSAAGDDGKGLVNHTAYAILFATTAGIMASVALQLFVESLSLNHNRNLSIISAFLGMVLMGVGSAISKHSH